MFASRNNNEPSPIAELRAVNFVCDQLAASYENRLIVEQARRQLIGALKSGALGMPEVGVLSQFAALPAKLIKSNSQTLAPTLSAFAQELSSRDAVYYPAFLRLLNAGLCKARSESFLILDSGAGALNGNIGMTPDPRYLQALFLTLSTQIEGDKFRDYERTFDLFRRLLRQYPVPADMLDNFIKTQSSEARSVKGADDMLSDLLGHACIKTAMRQSTWGAYYDYQAAMKGLNLGFWHGHMRTRAGQQILKNFADIYDVFEGFRSDTFAARRRPVTGALSAFQQFGAELGELSIIFQKSREGFPGPGLVIENLNLRRACDSYYDERSADPLHVYRSIWPSVAGELADLAQSRFVISRSFIAITGPVDRGFEKYCHENTRSKALVHYSLVIFNANHGNTANDVAMLVPTSILDEQLKQGVVKLTPKEVIPEPLNDLNTAALRPQQLRDLARAKGLYCLDVGNPAVASGRYEYAYPPSAGKIERPVFPARFGRQAVHGMASEDFLIIIITDGEVDSSVLVSSSEHESIARILMRASNERENTARITQVSSNEHENIARITQSNIALLKALRLVRARWSKGLTAANEENPVTFSQSELDQALARQRLKPHWDVSCARMLRLMYQWNELRNPAHGFAHRDDPDYFPVLVPADSGEYARAIPPGTWLIDSFSGVGGAPGLTFRKSNGAHETLNSRERGRSLEESVFFVREILQHATNDGIELRMMDRRSVNWKSI